MSTKGYFYTNSNSVRFENTLWHLIFGDTQAKLSVASICVRKASKLNHMSCLLKEHIAFSMSIKFVLYHIGDACLSPRPPSSDPRQCWYCMVCSGSRPFFIGSPIALSHVTFKDQRQICLRFRSTISCKGAELGHILLLNINRKLYMGSPIPPTYFTLSDIERSKLRCRK